MSDRYVWQKQDIIHFVKGAMSCLADRAGIHACYRIPAIDISTSAYLFICQEHSRRVNSVTVMNFYYVIPLRNTGSTEIGKQ